MIPANQSKIEQIPSPDDLPIILVAEFKNVDSETLFNYWIDPSLLKTWWPPEAEIEPKIDGKYHLSWPNQNWHLRGRYTEFDPSKKLSFTWTWDHEPDDMTEVKLVFEPISENAARLTLTHGTYLPTEKGRESRKNHVEGWMYFLGRLGETCSNNKKC